MVLISRTTCSRLRNATRTSYSKLKTCRYRFRRSWRKWSNISRNLRHGRRISLTKTCERRLKFSTHLTSLGCALMQRRRNSFKSKRLLLILLCRKLNTQQGLSEVARKIFIKKPKSCPKLQKSQMLRSLLSTTLKTST